MGQHLGSPAVAPPAGDAGSRPPGGWPPCASIVAEYVGYAWFLHDAAPDWFPLQVSVHPPPDEIDELAAAWIRARHFQVIGVVIVRGFKVRTESDVVADAVVDVLLSGFDRGTLDGLGRAFYNNGHPSLMHEHRTIYMWERWAYRAAFRSNLEVARAVLRHVQTLRKFEPYHPSHGDRVLREIWAGAAASGVESSLRSLWASVANSSCMEDAMSYAAGAGHCGCMRYLRHRGVKAVPVRAATMFGQFSAVVLCRRWSPLYPEGLLTVAARPPSLALHGYRSSWCSSLSVLKYCWKWSGRRADEAQAALADAIEYDCREAVAWCLGLGVVDVAAAFFLAAKKGQAAVCELIWQHDAQRCDTTRGFEFGADSAHWGVMAVCYAHGADTGVARIRLVSKARDSASRDVVSKLVDDFLATASLLQRKPCN